MGTTATFTTYDRNSPSKASTMSVPCYALVTTQEVQDIADALDAIVLGTNVRAVRNIGTVIDPGLPGPASDENAERGNRWLMRTFVADDNGGEGAIYKNEIGTADNSQLPSSSDDFLDLSAGVGLALKTAWEAAYLSLEGNTGVLLSVQQVNRADN